MVVEDEVADEGSELVGVGSGRVTGGRLVHRASQSEIPVLVSQVSGIKLNGDTCIE